MTSGRRTLAVLAEQAVGRTGEHASLAFEGQIFRNTELADRAARVGGGLREMGVRPGDRVVVLMANCPEVTITYGALWRAGAVVTPVIFLLTADELVHVLVDSSAVAVVTTSEFLAKVSAAVVQAPAVRHVVVVGEIGRGGGADGGVVTPYAALEAAAPAGVVDRADDDLAALLYTGGTTGRAKGVMLSHDNLWTAGASSHAASYVPGLTRNLLPLPLSHAYGILVTAVGMHVPEPGFTVLMRWFGPAGWLSLADEHRITRSSLVPSMLQILLGQPLEEADLSALRYVSSGGAPLAREVADEFERRVPGVEILEGYGCTETSAIISTNRPTRRRLGSVGEAVSGVDVRILTDDGVEVPPGTTGEITVRSATVMRGYWHADDETAAVLRDGWLRTGDIGRVDDDGYLYVVDRKKDLILRGGFNVFPRDIEDVLLGHPDVVAAGVVGRPDLRYGEEVVAFVTLRAGASTTAEDLVAFGRTRLSTTKYPREVHLVDAVPLTSVGKTDRKALRSRLLGFAGPLSG
ncbi:MAG: AMP-binding protein [Actinomycetota bacterium]|nr:AMP-binding protein [Actinomycetota bacterium]